MSGGNSDPQPPLPWWPVSKSERVAAVAVTGSEVEREAPGRPVAEIRDALPPPLPVSSRNESDQPVRGDHVQDHSRAGGWSPPLGAALGFLRRRGIPRNAQERGEEPALF